MSVMKFPVVTSLMVNAARLDFIVKFIAIIKSMLVLIYIGFYNFNQTGKSNKFKVDFSR